MVLSPDRCDISDAICIRITQRLALFAHCGLSEINEVLHLHKSHELQYR